jgi:membrane protease YdiL (CAAX protease family)
VQGPALPLPARRPCVHDATVASVADPRALLPARAAWVGLGGFVVGVLLALAGAALGGLLAPDVLLVRLLLSQAGLWAGLLGACVVASRRWGTGRLRDDYGLRARGSDVGRGLLLSLGARFAGGLVLAVLVAVAPELAGTNTEIFRLAEGDRAALLTLAVLAVVGAPLVEETFFRGLLLRSLRRRLSVAPAVAVQALAFGLVHSNPSAGRQNVGVVLVVGVAGLVLGAAAERYRRLGPSVWAHVFFNLVPVVVLLAL